MFKPITQYPFRFNGKVGQMKIRYGRNRGSSYSGFNLLSEDLAKWDVRGFPTMCAEVSYPGRGYGRYFAYIQVVSYLYPKPKPDKKFVDLIPCLMGADSPFAVIGHLPQFYDAPAWRDRQRGKFVAECFLVSPPFMDKKSPIQFVSGVRWGFEIGAAGGSPRNLPLKQLSGADWTRQRGFLSKKFLSWRF